MLSRAGQSVLRPVTPSTPALSPKSPPSVGSPVGADIALASFADDSATSSLGQAQPAKDRALEPVNPTIRRRSSGFSAASRRRLTVESGRRLISDFIDSSSQEENSKAASIMSRQHPAQEIQTPGAVLSVWGSATTPSDRFVPFFAQKGMNFDGELSTMKHRVGIISHRGYKPESPNQDDFFILARSDSLLLGVLDGHGPDGHDVSHFAQERLPMYLTEHLRKDPEAWVKGVGSSVRDLCEKAREDLSDKVEQSGTTVTLAMLDQPGGSSPRGPLRLRCAFLGDSIAVWARRKSRSDPWEVKQLTDIHRPDREDELKRIELAGGAVMAGYGRCPSRLVTPEWNLAMSRSFGDFHALPYGLSNEPEFPMEVLLEPDYQHMLLACSDGVWDVIQPNQAVQFVGKFSPQEAQLAVERLVCKAQLRWQETEDVVDDITAVLVWPGFADE